MKNTATAVRQNESRQFAINVSANMAVMGLNILIGLWFTPYLIRHLGIATYGVVILAISLTNYMSIFNSAIDNAVGRYLTIDIRSHQFFSANRTFNTALWAGLLIVFLLLPIVGLVSYFSPGLFDVPVGQEQSARWLFAGVMISYLLIIPRSVFTASTFAYNRLDLQNIIFASSIILRVVLVMLIFSFVVVPQAWQIGVAFLISTIGSLYLAIIYWKRLTPELTVSHHLIERKRLMSMFGMSGWLLVNQVGTLLFLSIDLIIVNRYLGVAAQGKYGSVLQLSIMLRTLAMTVTKAITPIALAHYARQEMYQLSYLTQKAVKVMGLAIALPVGAVVGFASPLLSIWLAPEFVELQRLLVILIAHLCLNLAVQPLFSIQTVLNKVRLPGLVTLGMGLVNLVLAIWWVQWGHFGIGVALASGLILTLKNTVFLPLYGAHIQQLPWYTFLGNMWPSVMGTLFVACLSFVLAQAVSLNSWFDLLAAVAAVALVYGMVVYTIGLTRDDRQFLKKILVKTRN